MHIPNVRVYNEMRSERASLWFVPARGKEDIAFLIKSTTASIKSLISGCPLRLVFGKHSSFLCTGVRIYDVPGSPLLICGVQRYAEEHLALQRVLDLRRVPVFLFNELDVCVAWANLELAKEDALSVRRFAHIDGGLYVGPFSQEASSALDCFCFTIDNTDNVSGAHAIEMIDVCATVGEWQTSDITFIGAVENHKFIIDNPDEGATLEKAVWWSLESMFLTRLYKNPQIRNGEKLRELTDVLAFHQYRSFFFETKDLSIFSVSDAREQTRRTKGVKKQVKNQLSSW